jgi:hypothetical protein
MKAAIKIWGPLLVLFFFGNSAKAITAQADFVVYYAKGKVLKIDAVNSRQLKKGDKLYAADNLSLPANAQLVLICSNYNSISINKPGVVKLSGLLSRCSKSRSTFTTAYLHFIWDEFNTEKEKSGAEDYMNNVGAVSRGKAFKMNIHPDTINYCKGELTISWKIKKKDLIAKVFNSPAADEAINQVNVTGSHFKLDALISGLKTPGIYYWGLFEGNNPAAGNYYLRVLSKLSYTKKVNALTGTALVTSPAETAFMKGFVLEQNHFLVEAAKYYNKAALLEPGNKLYLAAKSRIND